MSSQSAKMIATVKGLGPTKVNTLVDAFSKPFLVGGLKRGVEDGGSGGLESGGVTSATPNKGTSTSRSDERPTKKAKGKEKAVEEERAGSDERMGSPDWPEEEEEDDGPCTGDSNSPVIVSENGNDGEVSGAGKGSEVWRDPLEDDEPDSEPEQDKLTVGNGDKRGKRQPSELRRRLSGGR
jgi:DNA excision repair protein ERCC-1